MFSGIGNAVMGLFGDQSGGFNNYADQMRQQSQAYNPYINRGNAAGDRQAFLSDWLTKNPNALQDQIASGYQMSPYQNNLLDTVTNRMNMNAANTGMLRSPLAQKALNDQANTMTGQFMNDYVNRGENNFGLGMQNYGMMNTLGMQGLTGQSDLLQQAAAANLKADQSRQNAISSMLGLGAGIGLNMLMPGAGAAMGVAGSSGGFQGAGSLNPNVGGWTGTPSSSSIMRMFG